MNAMSSFVVVPASPSDLESVTRLQFAACAQDVGFSSIYPRGATADTVQHTIAQFESDLEANQTAHLMLVKDALTTDVVAYAAWHFLPQRAHEDIEREMLNDHFPLPKDANLETGNRLIHAGVRKHHEVVARHFGHGAAHACASQLHQVYEPAPVSNAANKQILPPLAPTPSMPDRVRPPCCSIGDLTMLLISRYHATSNLLPLRCRSTSNRASKWSTHSRSQSQTTTIVV